MMLKMRFMASKDWYLIKSVKFSLHHSRPLTYAASVAVNTSRLVPQPPDLIKWVKREGGYVHQLVKIKQSGQSGFGLVASEEIPKGSELIALPECIPLRFESSGLRGADGSDSILLNLARQIPEELWAMRLGLKLLQERAKIGSFWWPYISNLPETYGVPIFFREEDIKELQYTPLRYQIKKRCRFLLDFAKQVKHAVENTNIDDHPFGGQDLDASTLGWAMSAVSSRAFRLYGKKLTDGTNNDVPVMLPLIDMCNHSFNPNARIIQEQDTGNPNMIIKMVAETHIKRDDPLLLSYGNLNNDLFVLDYGFVIPSNPYDCIELKYDSALLDVASVIAGVSSPKFSSPAPWQQKMLSQLKITGEDPLLKVSIGGPETVEPNFLAALRVLLAEDMKAVQEHDLSELQSLSAEAPLGISNESGVLRTIISLCVIALEHFPTKITEDETLLKNNNTSSTQLAIQFRIQKKSVLIDVMKDLARRVKLLSSKESLSSESGAST